MKKEKAEKTQQSKKETDWAEAKRRCRLSDEAVNMAKEMGLNPRKLIKNIPNKNQSWKAPVEDWVRDMYAKRGSKSTSKETVGTVHNRPINPSNQSNKSRTGKTKGQGKPGARENLAEICQILKSITDETIPERLWDKVEWMIERGHENLLYQLIEEEELTEEAIDTLEFLLYEIGYRYPITMKSTAPDNRVEYKQSLMIPFGVIFAVIVRADDINRIPTTLPKTIKEVTEKRLFRQASDLGETPSLLLDAHLYHIDHAEWSQLSSVRRYLEGCLSYLAGLSSTIPPLSSEYKKPPAVRFAATGQVNSREIRHSLIMRVLCGVAIAEDGEEASEVEEILFDEDKQSNISKVQDAYQQIEDIITAELESLGISDEMSVFIYPQLLDLKDIPQVGLSLYRRLPLQIALESALQELDTSEITDSALLYVSYHGNYNQVEEIRLAAYQSTTNSAFFRYIWPIEYEIDSVEEVTDTILDVANQLDARIMLVDGLIANDRCSECGEPTFFGPGDQQIHDHQDHQDHEENFLN
ncbi:MAG: hypothetical protein AB1489_19470 [Acidobacteriota bacterium]